MNALSKWIAVLLTAVSLQASATILPPNNLGMYDNLDRVSNIDEAMFNRIVDQIIEIWKPLAKLHGAELVAEKLWKDSTVNAYAEQYGNTWKISMFGGLARRPEVTPDGFALVVCHELGHHFAGHFFWGDGEWAASEGESDYYATHVCAQKIFNGAFERNFRYRPNVPAPIKAKCDTVWKDPTQQDKCYRTVHGGLSLARLLAAAGGERPPQFETPDTSKVRRSDPRHPKAQCRLDTYVAGATCLAPFDVRIIPGKGHPNGNNSPDAEQMAAMNSCTPARNFTEGIRPGCWFRSQTQDLNENFMGLF